MKTRYITITTISLVSGFAFAFFSVPVFASCAALPPLGAEFSSFDRAQTVFVGTVTNVYNPHPDIHPGTEEYDTITFDVIRVLKGDAGDGTVRSGHHSLGYNGFEVGKTYLVYAFAGIREVSQCTPPILLSGESTLTIYDGSYYLPYLLIVLVAVVPSVIIWRKKK